MSDRLLLPESLVMLHPERLEETWVTWGWIPSARCSLLKSAGSWRRSQETRSGVIYLFTYIKHNYKKYDVILE